MGDYGSYDHVYKLGETIPELKGVTILLDGRIDDFVGSCPECEALFDVGARYFRGKG